MRPDFDFKRIVVTEFGVGIVEDEGEQFVLVPVDNEVQHALQEMVEVTQDALNEPNQELREYEPSEKYESQEQLNLPLSDDLAAQIRLIHEADNLVGDAAVLTEPEGIFCYFVRMRDGRAAA